MTYKKFVEAMAERAAAAWVRENVQGVEVINAHTSVCMDYRTILWNSDIEVEHEDYSVHTIRLYGYADENGIHTNLVRDSYYGTTKTLYHR